MINRLVIFGATGDLTARFLLPALADLQAAGHLGDHFQLTGASREDWDSDQYQEWATTQLNRHGGTCPADARSHRGGSPLPTGRRHRLRRRRLGHRR
ncbi:hypothetical protein [Streptomyces sp. NPDC005507]|uniref:hypothetical protein n=1 Tax=unclassified Streptomyces TaxID=2593676 RepID=UPI0033A3EB6D